MVEIDGPSFHPLISAAACLISLCLILGQVRTLRDAATRFVLFALWQRYSIAMFHAVTYKPAVAGLSLAALATVGTVALGVAVVGTYVFRLARLKLLYLFLVAVVVSAVLNARWNGLLANGLKWIFLILITAAAYEGIKRHGPARFYRAVAVVLAVPIGLQWLSYAADLKKISESSTSADLAVSYIGGHQHQAGFAIIILTFLVVAIFSAPRRFLTAVSAMALVLAGLVLADYRTAIIAALPPVAAFLMVEGLRRFRESERGFVLVVLAGLVCLGLVAFAELKQDRFADLANVADKGSALIKPPEHFTEPEQKMLSGRAVLWSEYISDYARFDLGWMLIGRGPDAWVGQFPLYAHNTFVSFLYEYGLLGLGLFIVFLVGNFVVALRAAGMSRLILVSCHLGFALLCLGTMPMWIIDGVVLYSLLLARTWYANLEWIESRVDPHPVLVPA